MKIFPLAIIFFLFLEKQAVCQKFIYDTTDTYYAGVKFSFQDDLNYWTYKFHPKKTTRKDKSIGVINFWRTERWDDSKDAEFHTSWNPHISFDIYNLEDSAIAQNTSRIMRAITSCVPPHTGGDYFIVGNFVFVNPVSCVSCYRGKNNTDYCRPTIYRIFKSIDLTKVTSLKDIIQQLEIKSSYN